MVDGCGGVVMLFTYFTWFGWYAVGYWLVELDLFRLDLYLGFAIVMYGGLQLFMNWCLIGVRCLYDLNAVVL